MYFFVFCAISLVGHLVADKVPFTSCKGGDTVSSIVIDPCNMRELSATKSACVLQHGSTVKVNAVFLAPFSSSSLEIAASATIDKHMLPLPDSGSNPCQGKIIPGCPVQKGNLYIFQYNFNVMKFYPTGSLEVTFAIRDRKNKKLLSCAIVPVIIKKNPAIRYASSVPISGVDYA